MNAVSGIAPGVPSGPMLLAAPVAPAVRRSTQQRLAAHFATTREALSPRRLRHLLRELQGVLDPAVSEVEGGRRAKAIAERYLQAGADERRDILLLISEQFAPDARAVQRARELYEQALGTAEQGEAEMRLRRVLRSPRSRLLQRFAAHADGMRFLVDLRAELLGFLKDDKRLATLDAELELLFSTWFDVGFLELRRINWDSPASLLEKLIRYEAVHDIRSWSDLKNRLDSDRRCYGFFHPRLPDDPLIFVEVAFTDQLADNVATLLDEAAPPLDPRRADTAIFYSISNTQPGLKGVSFGDSLLKRVVEALREELPRLKTFATLSPIPGFRSWLKEHAAEQLDHLESKEQAELGRALGDEAVSPTRFLEAAERVHELDARHPVAKALLRLAARYLVLAFDDGRPRDAVARFHLGNGARVECLNFRADLSPKGLKQAYGLMVNYLYDLKRLDKHRAVLATGRIARSRQIEALL